MQATINNNYYVYILTSKAFTLYIGVTNDLERRIYEHKNKIFEGFTKKYNIDKLIYFQIFQDITGAIEYEKKLKGWTRKKKMQLIKSINPTFSDLSINL